MRVLALDPGKTYGYAILRSGNPVQKPYATVGKGVPLSIGLVDVLVAEGTSFGRANTHIQRCIGRFEGLLGLEAKLLSVRQWRRVVWPERRKCDNWKRLAVMEVRLRKWHTGVKGFGDRDCHHACEAMLLGWAYTQLLDKQSDVL